MLIAVMPTINVLDYGAKGDGTTDDGPAIQLAINALPNGGSVFIPEGEYLISTGIQITKGIRILGAGRANFNGYTDSFSTTVHSGATLIRITTGKTAFSFNKGSNVTAFGCSIEEMSFAGTTISQAAFAAAPSFNSNTHAINMSDLSLEYWIQQIRLDLDYLPNGGLEQLLDWLEKDVPIEEENKTDGTK